ncbi:tRNA 2-selenouridine synthase [Campylobacter concisus]|uniref:tRNA 2-selenouridine synthase n=1 Tax=Campylobacter concisus TaxID=199 RepID=A0A1Y5MPC4_9BACT|nr:tRNA 2-selenouridine synthase [Campylobacter concisus]OUT07492.1 tRNA 2-selenouridine synthase [Campylobacter concisus]
MKFVAITLLLLTSIFLIACSANQASNKISNSELENLASKYGGVYVFNQKFVEEIEKREAERKELSKKMKGRDLGDGLYAVDPKPINEKLPQILSNGKPYFKGGTSSKISESCYEEIYKFIGDENLKKYKPWIFSNLYYKDKDERIVQISCTVAYERVKTQYGLFGDEAKGISFKKNSFESLGGGNRFVLINGKFERVSKDK